MNKLKAFVHLPLSSTYSTFACFLLGGSSFQVIFFGLLPCSRSIHKLFEPYTCSDQIDSRWQENSIDSKRIHAGHQLWRTTSRARSWWWWVGTLYIAIPWQIDNAQRLYTIAFTVLCRASCGLRYSTYAGVVLLWLLLTHSIEQSAFCKLLVSHLTKIFQSFL
jgi:hypothetical protein